MAREPRPALDVVDHLLDMLAPGLDASGDRAMVDEGVRRIIDRGTGSVTQRRLGSNMSGDALVRELRLAGGTGDPAAG